MEGALRATFLKELFKDKKFSIAFCLLSVISIFLLFFSGEYADVFRYHASWCHYIQDSGLFHIYDNSVVAFNYDYPPIVSFLLFPFSYFIDLLYLVFFQLGESVITRSIVIPSSHPLYQVFMFLVKVPFIIPNVVFVIYVYKKISKKFALAWIVNPLFIIDLLSYGQSDTLLCICLFFMLKYFYDKKYTSATIWFAIGCLTKLQMLYFAPIFLVLLLKSKSIKKIFSCIGIGLSIGIVVFLPFMIASKNIFLPFDVYLGGFGKYTGITFASNIWWIVKNFVGLNIELISDIPGGSILNIVLFLSIILFFSWKIFKKENFLPYVALYMFSIFEFCLLQHERYVVPAIVPLMMLLFLYGNKTYSKATYVLAITGTIEIASHMGYNYSDMSVSPQIFSFVDFICVFGFIIAFILLVRSVLLEEKSRKKIIQTS